MLGRILRTVAKIRRLFRQSEIQMEASERRQRDMLARLESLAIAVGRLESRLDEGAEGPLTRHEFRVFSQFGDDGIIDYLVRTVPVTCRRFVEFGVQDYTESNTRFLLAHRNWSGLVMDGSASQVAKIRGDNDFWRYPLKASCEFITRENINELLQTHGFAGELGILSIDIDGNDYWVWEAINVVDPAVVVIEYNHRFGPDLKVTIPYDPGFVVDLSQGCGGYYGASLAALCDLGRHKGYDFVGCNSAGLNAYFVKSSLRPARLPTISAKVGFIKSTFKDKISETGGFDEQYESVEDSISTLQKYPLVDLSSKYPPA